jgi:ATP-binding cassette, subfamily B, bacterial PglK
VPAPPLSTFRALLRVLSRHQIRSLWLLLGAAVLGTVAELVTIGAVVPFLALMSSPETASEFAGVRLLDSLVGDEADLLWWAMGLLIAAAIVTAAARLLLLWTVQRTVTAIGHETGTRIYSRMLRQPYGYYLQRNPSELYASLQKIDSLTFGVLMPMVQAVNAMLIALGIILFLIAIDPLSVAIGAVFITIIYAFITVATRGRLRRNSRILSKTQNARLQAIQEGLGGIRDILLAHTQPVFEKSFAKLDQDLRRAQATNSFIAGAPRFIIEATGIVAIGFLAVLMSERTGGILGAIPTLGALALGAQRLLPLIQQAYTGWTVYAGNAAVVDDLIALLEAPIVEDSEHPERGSGRPFERDIVFDQVSLSYPGRGQVLHQLSLAIRRGERVGVVGRTGSGKSSFLDVFMALLPPQEGEIRIDGVPLAAANRAAWQAQIAHVPQSVYLSDSTIASNIAFGEAEEAISMARAEAAARQADMHEFILSLPQGYQTLVGERGVRLSGGQRQRIAIARALYKEASVLIFDEATGALDRQTEKAIISAISSLERDVTILVVAHSLSALSGCDRIIRMEKGRIVDSGEIADLVRG